MTKKNKIVAGIIAGALAIGGGVALFNTSTTETAIKHYPIKNMLKANLHEWDIMVSDPDFNNAIERTNNLQQGIIDAKLTGVRIYVDIGASKSDDNSLFQLSPNRRGWRVDSGLLALKARDPNFTVLYTYQGAPKNIQTEYESNGEKNSIYVRRGADRTDVNSYKELGHDIYVLASRGGTNKNVRDYPMWSPDNTWETRPTYYKGAGFINTVEPSNEPDNQWMTIPMNGYQIAAMSSVAYDSAKSADPNIIVSSAGVASDDTTLLSQALDWSRKTGKKFCDKWQFHSYASGMWQNGGNVASGLPPEISTSKQAKKVVALASKNGLPAFVGEWGYDINPRSWLGVPVEFGGYTRQEIRAYWCARQILDYAAIGVESAYYYRWHQDYGEVNDSNETVFASSSLAKNIEGTNIQKRRLNGDVFTQLSQFGEYIFDRAIIDNDSVKLYVFKSGTQELYAGWTVERMAQAWIWNANRAVYTERKVNYNLSSSGTRYDISEDSNGVFKQSAFNGGNITLSSKPLFILIGGSTPPPPPPPPPPTHDTAWIYTNRKGYWIISNKRVYYKVYLVTPDSLYQIRTGNYTWYKQ